jgi:hypothetical protein
MRSRHRFAAACTVAVLLLWAWMSWLAAQPPTRAAEPRLLVTAGETTWIDPPATHETIVCNTNFSRSLEVRTIGVHTQTLHERRHGGAGATAFAVPPGACVHVDGDVRLGACPDDSSARRAWVRDTLVPPAAFAAYLREARELPLYGACDFVGATALVLLLHFARPEFLEMQSVLLRHHLAPGAAAVVLIDAFPPAFERYAAVWRMHKGRRDARRAMVARCIELGMCCLPVPPAIHAPCGYMPARGRGAHEFVRTFTHDPAVRTAAVVQWALDTLGYVFDGDVLLLDGDMAPVAPLDPAAQRGGAAVAAVPWHVANSTITHLYPGIVALRPAALPRRFDLEWCVDKDGPTYLDAGGCTRRWLAAHPAVPVAHMRYTIGALSRIGIGGEVAHYIGGGMWGDETAAAHDARFARFYCGALRAVYAASPATAAAVVADMRAALRAVPADFVYDIECDAE